MFPATGPLRRELYVPHMEFFEAGAEFPERAFIAGNRTGKSEAGAFELTCHLTGVYPSWWTGKRFTTPIEAWAGGINNVTTRDVIQEKMLGKAGEHGTGMIPGDSIIQVTNKQGMFGAVDTVYVRHVSGGRSALAFKSYEQGRESWQGTAKHYIWFDEEPPKEVYVEGLLRTATTDGVVVLTFTPLLGMSDVVKAFAEPDEAAKAVKKMITATWDDAPHLTEKAKASLMASIPPYQRDARTKGIPQLGVGAIYPLAEADIVCDRFQIPNYWRRCFGMDVGWNRTAAIWLALNPDTYVWYAFHEHYRGNAEPIIHAQGIKAPGAWIPGVIDPASMGSSQVDGRQLIAMYQDMGLDLEPAINSVETGIYEVWNALSSGQLKVFRDLGNWLSEFRKYHRNEKGVIVKADDHLMDATRYGWMSGRDRAKAEPVKQPPNQFAAYGVESSTGWMA